MTLRRLAPLAALVAAGCATAPAPQPAPVARAPVLPAQGLERVMGRDARALVALFGDPDQDMREATGRKLQFDGAACVLDAYLYPKAGGEPVTTWIDARTPAGDDFDRASCVAALSRRPAAR